MKTKIISIMIALAILSPGLALAQKSKSTSTTSNCYLDLPYDPISNPCGQKETPKQKQIDSSKNEEIGKKQLGDSFGEDKKPQLDSSDEGAAKRKEEEKKLQQETFCKEYYGMSCDEYRKKREADCINAGYPGGCAQRDEALKNTGGTGFKLNLDALTLTSNGQKSGKELFQNKEYTEKYGVVLGIILRAIDIMIYVIGSLAMITLIIAGLFMITNHGDDAWVNRGKTMMLYSVLGVLFALLSFAFVNLIQTALA